MESIIDHGDDCHDESEELLPTVNTENSLCNKSEDDDHSGGEEDTKGS